MTENLWKVKNLEVLNLDPKLIDLADAVKAKWQLYIVTSAYRPGDPGVHGTNPTRGLDLRCSDDYTGRIVVDWVNALWEYDPERPTMVCCIYHDVGFGRHLHLQVCANTRKKDLSRTNGKMPV